MRCAALLTLTVMLAAAGCAREPAARSPHDDPPPPASQARVAQGASKGPTEIATASITPQATASAPTAPSSTAPSTTAPSTASPQASATAVAASTPIAPTAETSPDPTRALSLTTTLAGIHFAGEASAAEVFGRADLEGWAVELAYVMGPGSEPPHEVARRMRDRRARGFRPILRIDYVAGQNLPVLSDSDGLAIMVTFAAEVVALSEGALAHVIIGNEPNIDTDGFEPGRLTECLAGREHCAPTASMAPAAAASAPPYGSSGTAPAPGTTSLSRARRRTCAPPSPRSRKPIHLGVETSRRRAYS